MERPVETGDLVEISLGEDIQMYVIQNVSPNEIYVNLISDTTQQKLMIPTPEGWRLSGSTEKFAIKFVNRESLPQLLFTKVVDVDI